MWVARQELSHKITGRSILVKRITLFAVFFHTYVRLKGDENMMPPQPPTVNPNSLDFGNLPQGDSKTLQEVISNPSEQTLLWHADTCGTRWLTLDRSESTLQLGQQQIVNVKVDTSSLAVGNYAATLIFTSEGDAESKSIQVPVTLSVLSSHKMLAAGQNFAASPLAVGLSFALSANSCQTLPLAITNRYGQTLHWKADSSENWLALDRNEGDLKPHKQQTIWVTAKAGQLVSKDYPANLNFTLEILGAKLKSVKFPVELHVLPSGITAFGDDGPHAPIVILTRLDFVAGGKNPLSLQITNQEDRGKVNWTINAGGANWLEFNMDDGSFQNMVGGSFQNMGDMVTVNVKAIENLPTPGASTDSIIKVAFADPPLSSREPTIEKIPVTMTVP